MTHPTKQIFYLCLFLLTTATSGVTLAAPSADLWQRWAMHNPASTRNIDHGLLNDLLKRHVSIHGDGVNRFNYAQVDAAQRKQLQRYLLSLAATPISSFNRAQQLAFWINLYNALTVETILEHYPLDGIRDISSGFFSSGPWGLKLITVENEQLTLNDIEHRILRPIWRDPRIHYAVNCASIGCPNLQPQAFNAEQREAMLDKAAGEFINHPRAASIDNGRLQVSRIYDWFEADFGGSEFAVIEHLRIYADVKLAKELQGIERIDDFHYDWSLNEQKALTASR